MKADDAPARMTWSGGDFAARTSPQKTVNIHGPSMQHSTSFRHMLSLR
jgi:hypothetical protein